MKSLNSHFGKRLFLLKERQDTLKKREGRGGSGESLCGLRAGARAGSPDTKCRASSLVPRLTATGDKVGKRPAGETRVHRWDATRLCGLWLLTAPAPRFPHPVAPTLLFLSSLSPRLWKP